MSEKLTSILHRSRLRMALSFSLLAALAACSHSRIRENHIYNGTLSEAHSVVNMVQSVKPGSVVLLGEEHTHIRHHKNQLEVIERLAEIYPHTPIYVAIEHFPYTAQTTLEAYQDHLINEDVFLNSVQMPLNFFEYYRDLVKSRAHARQVRGLAINLPKSITRKVGQSGIESLSAHERTLLPPQPTLGREAYLERTTEALQSLHPMDPTKLQNYLWAQSLWDDTMAWRIAMQLQAKPESIIVVAVGNFHVDYGGGLPDRLRRRGVNDILTVVQIPVRELSIGQKKSALLPHPKWGARAQYIWTTD